MNTKKYYFLPFVDYLLALLVTLLFTMFFGSWFTNKIFGFIMGTALTLTMCGFVYSRMWKLSRNNTRYGYGLDSSYGMKFALPLTITTLLIAIVYCLAEYDVIPLKDTILKTYYTFPDNLPRKSVHITVFDYATVFVRFWFFYFAGFSTKNVIWLYFLSPLLILFFSSLGFRLGAENKEMLEKYAKLMRKAKDKFNE